MSGTENLPEEVVQRVTEQLSALVDGSDNRPLAVRVELAGACLAHRQLVAEPHRWTAEIQAAAFQLGRDRVWIEQIIRNTSLPADGDTDIAPDGAIAEHNPDFMIRPTEARTERETRAATQRAEDTGVQPAKWSSRFHDVRGRADEITTFGHDRALVRQLCIDRPQ